MLLYCHVWCPRRVLAGVDGRCLARQVNKKINLTQEVKRRVRHPRATYGPVGAVLDYSDAWIILDHLGSRSGGCVENQTTRARMTDIHQLYIFHHISFVWVVSGEGTNDHPNSSTSEFSDPQLGVRSSLGAGCPCHCLHPQPS